MIRAIFSKGRGCRPIKGKSDRNPKVVNVGAYKAERKKNDIFVGRKDDVVHDMRQNIWTSFKKLCSKSIKISFYRGQGCRWPCTCLVEHLSEGSN